jgi:hypothetical protein
MEGDGHDALTKAQNLEFYVQKSEGHGLKVKIFEAQSSNWFVRVQSQSNQSSAVGLFHPFERFLCHGPIQVSREF